MEVSREKVQDKFVRKIEELSEQNVFACYQCGKCSAGCPLTEEMDILPHTIIRLLQLGEWQDTLDSKTIWHCSTCLQCSVKCPKGIDVAKLMDTLRVIMRRKGIDKIELAKISEKMWKTLPQQALVSGFRKHNS